MTVFGAHKDDLTVSAKTLFPNEVKFTAAWGENMDLSLGTINQLIRDYPGFVIRGEKKLLKDTVVTTEAI